MREIVLRAGESITIGDTTIRAEYYETSVVSDSRIPVQDDLRPILVEILAKGVKQSEVARYLGIAPASVSEALNGGRAGWVPSYPNGVRLMQLYRKVCGEGAAHA